MVIHRLSKILLHNTTRFQRPPTEPVVASTCVRVPTIPDFAEAQSAAVAVPPISETLLAKKATNFKEVFSVLRQTPTGRAVMAKFDPKFGFEVKVEQYGPASSAVGGKRAAAIFDLEKRTIYVDRQEKIGTVAPILLHEMIHSLDKDYLRAVEREKALWNEFDGELMTLLRAVSRRSGKATESLEEADFAKSELDDVVRMKLALEQYRDVRIYRAERVAYDFYYQVLYELAEKYPQFYLAGRRSLASLHPFSDADLIRVENLSPLTIQKYKSGLCRAFQ